MNNKIKILILTVGLLVFGTIASIQLNAAVDPLSTSKSTSATSTETSSERVDYLSSSRQSIGASTTHQTISANSKHILRASDADSFNGWGDPFLPGGDGWVDGGTGNVGYPIGDASGAMLLMMIVIYFIYRGVSTTKRRNNI